MSSAKIVFVGAGSTVFAKNLIGDTLGIAGINHMAFYLEFERDGEDLSCLIH